MCTSEPEGFELRNFDFRKDSAVDGLNWRFVYKRNIPTFFRVRSLTDLSWPDVLNSCRSHRRHLGKPQAAVFRNRHIIAVAIGPAQLPNPTCAEFALPVNPDGELVWLEIECIDRLSARILRGKKYPEGIRCPCKRSYPTIPILGEIPLLSRLAVIEHQAEAVALVSRTLLGAVGDVTAIGRIERRRVAGGIVGGDVLGLDGRGARPYIDRNDPQ